MNNLNSFRNNSSETLETISLTKANMALERAEKWIKQHPEDV